MGRISDGVLFTLKNAVQSFSFSSLRILPCFTDNTHREIKVTLCDTTLHFTFKDTVRICELYKN